MPALIQWGRIRIKVRAVFQKIGVLVMLPFSIFYTTRCLDLAGFPTVGDSSWPTFLISTSDVSSSDLYMMNDQNLSVPQP